MATRRTKAHLLNFAYCVISLCHDVSWHLLNLCFCLCSWAIDQTKKHTFHYFSSKSPLQLKGTPPAWCSGCLRLLTTQASTPQQGQPVCVMPFFRHHTAAWWLRMPGWQGCWMWSWFVCYYEKKRHSCLNEWLIAACHKLWRTDSVSFFKAQIGHYYVNTCSACVLIRGTHCGQCGDSVLKGLHWSNIDVTLILKLNVRI